MEYNNTKKFKWFDILSFTAGCLLALLSLIDEESCFYKYRLLIGAIILSLSIVMWAINFINGKIQEYNQAKNIFYENYNLQNHMYLIDYVERKYVINRPNVLFQLKMKVINHYNSPISTIDIKIQADNDSTGDNCAPEIICKKIHINNEDVKAENNGRVINSCYIISPTRSGKILQQIVRLPLSQGGSLDPNESSIIFAEFELRNCLPIHSIQDSLFFEVSYLTKRISIFIESCDNVEIILAPTAECANGVGAYTLYGLTIDQDETKKIPAPQQMNNKISWTIEKPKLGYNYRLNFKLNTLNKPPEPMGHEVRFSSSP